MIVDNQFEIGEVVFLITDKSQNPYMITSFTVFKHGELVYKTVAGTYESSHYEFEMSRERSVLTTL